MSQAALYLWDEYIVDSVEIDFVTCIQKSNIQKIEEAKTNGEKIYGQEYTILIQISIDRKRVR